MGIKGSGPKEASSSEAMMQLAVFKVCGEEYAIDIMRIMEIIRPQKVTRIPRAPSFVEGVINLRGKVVPVVDLRKRFGMGVASEASKKVRTVIVRMSGRVLGLVVDEVSEVIYMKADQVEETPDTVKGAGVEYLKGVGKAGERLIIILDIEKVLSGEEMMLLKAAEEHAKEDGAA
jgi:purine-binding chemotaxis protein CheW